MLNDDPPEDDDEEESDDDSDTEEFRNVSIEEGDGNTIHLRGQAERDKLCDNMRQWLFDAFILVNIHILVVVFTSFSFIKGVWGPKKYWGKN